MRKLSRGFTVIEVLVAIALTMVVGWLVSLAFNNASQACRGVTATLDYRAKGAAIMDMLETDIANTCQYCKSGSAESTRIAFKAVLPRQRSHYHSGADFDANKGDYGHNVVSVRWQFTPGNAASGYPSSLYRKVSKPSDIAESFSDYQTAMANADCYVASGNAWDLSPKGADSKTPDFSQNASGTAIGDYLVTHTDIRDFDVSQVGPADNLTYNAADGAGNSAKAAVSGTIPRAYRVSFFLTNAPANVKSPREAATEAEKDALAAYIWEYFDRTIATR